MDSLDLFQRARAEGSGEDVERKLAEWGYKKVDDTSWEKTHVLGVEYIVHDRIYCLSPGDYRIQRTYTLPPPIGEVSMNTEWLRP